MRGNNQRYNSSMGGNGQGGDEDKRKNQGNDHNDHDTTPRNRKPRAKAAGRQNSANNYSGDASPYQQEERAERALQNALRHGISRGYDQLLGNRGQHAPSRIATSKSRRQQDLAQFRQDAARARESISQLPPLSSATSSSALNQTTSASPLFNPSNASGQPSQSAVPASQPFNMFAGQMSRAEALRDVAARVGIIPNTNVSEVRNNPANSSPLPPQAVQSIAQAFAQQTQPTQAPVAPRIRFSPVNSFQSSVTQGAAQQAQTPAQQPQALQARTPQPQAPAPQARAPQAQAPTNPTVRIMGINFAPNSGIKCQHQVDGHSFKYWVSIKPPSQDNEGNQQNRGNGGNQR